MSHCISSMASSGIGVHATGSAHLKGGGQATICTLKQRMDPVLFGYRPKLSTADLSLHGWQKLSIINWHSCLCNLNQISFLNRAQYSELKLDQSLSPRMLCRKPSFFPAKWMVNPMRTSWHESSCGAWGSWLWFLEFETFTCQSFAHIFWMDMESTWIHEYTFSRKSAS